jgi:hypothetical protein
MGGNGEGKKRIIIIWIWVLTRVDLSIPSPVAGLRQASLATSAGVRAVDSLNVRITHSAE